MLKNIYAKIEAEEAQNPVWIVGPETARILKLLVKVTRPQVVLEIGTSVGYSALHMTSGLEENGAGELWTIESHDDRHARAQEHFDASGLRHRIHSLKGHAPEIFTEPERWGYMQSDLPERVDFLFLDATKYEHPDFLAALKPKLNKDAFVVVDNTLSHRTGRMKEFVEGLLESPEFEACEIATEDGLLIARLL